MILNITNGGRLDTYVIKAKWLSNYIVINGAAAHHINAGDLVIIVAYCVLNESEVQSHNPIIVHVNEQNRIADKHPKSILSLN